jgi:excisionase family DNA binding protein
MMGKRQRKSGEGKILDVDASMQGNLVFRDAVNLRINGKFEGNLDTKGNLTIGEHAKVTADIKGDTIIVQGEVKGDITAAQKLTIGSTGSVEGNIVTSLFCVDEGAGIRGNIAMKPLQQGGRSASILSAEELARYLEVDTSVIFEWANTGKIPAVKEGNTFRFDRLKIDEWLASEKS